MHKGRDTRKRITFSARPDRAADRPQEKWILTEYRKSRLYAFFQVPSSLAVLPRYLRGFSFSRKARVLCLPQSGGKGGMPYVWKVSPGNGQRDSENKEFKNGGIQIETL